MILRDTDLDAAAKTVKPIGREFVTFTVPKIDGIVGAIIQWKVESPSYSDRYPGRAPEDACNLEVQASSGHAEIGLAYG